MSTKLDTPVSVRTRLGSVLATHQFHTINIIDQPGNNNRIVSTKTLGVEVDGVVQEINEGSESVTIAGTDLDALGSDFTIGVVKAKHAELYESVKAAKLAAAASQKADLEARLAYTKAQLDELTGAEAPAPAVTIGADTPQ